MATYQIIPIKMGEFVAYEKSIFTYLCDFGTKLPVPVVMFLLKGKDRVILVDTGGSDEEWARTYHYPIRQRDEERPLAALRRHGVDPADVDVIVNTHLHWDHCFNDPLFPKARIYVQRRELRYALDPLPAHRVVYESPQTGLRPRWQDAASRHVELDGDHHLCDGVELLLLPGHTPGLQGVLVDTEDGKYLLPSDTCPLMENWRGNRHHSHIPTSVHVDLREYYETFARIERTGAKVIASHDAEVVAKGVYP